MQSLKFFSVLFLAVLSLASCQKEDDLVPANETQTEIQESSQDAMSTSLDSRSGCSSISVGPNYSFNQAYNLNTQAEVDAFDPCITTINANFIINGPNITDLTPLRNVTTVHGWMDVVNTNAVDFDGLQGLQTINGRFRIFGNQEVTDISAVEGIEYVDGTIAVFANRLLNPCETLGYMDENTIVTDYIIEFQNDADCPLW